MFRSKWFWIFLLICIMEEMTFFMPFLSLFLLAATFSPKIALKFAKTFVEYYNQVNGTSLEITNGGSENNSEGQDQEGNH